MKKIFILLLFSLLGYSSKAQMFEWAKNHYRTSPGTFVKANNNSFVVTGSFKSKINLGSVTVTSKDSMTAYLAKFDLSGTLMWVKKIRDKTNSTMAAYDPNGNIILTGSYGADSVFIDNTFVFKKPVSTGLQTGIYIAKFSPAGNLLWFKTSDPGPLTSYNVYDVIADASGNIILSGGYNQNVPFTLGNVTLPAQSNPDLFVAKLDPSGNTLWLRNSGKTSVGNIWTPCLAINSTGDIHFSANLNSIGNHTYLAKYNPSGTMLWSKTIPVTANRMVLDDADNFYLSGTAGGTITVDNLTLKVSNATQVLKIFMLKGNPQGNFKWARKIAHGNYEGVVNEVAYGAENNIYITGTYNKTAFFHNFMLKSPTIYQNTYIAKIDTSGTTQWVSTVKGNNFNVSTSISANNIGQVFIAGYSLIGSSAFGPITLNNTIGSANGYLAKINDKANTIRGIVFKDMNSNGVKDPNELPVPEAIVTAMPDTNAYGASYADGSYNVYVKPGTYSVLMPNPPAHYTSTPASHSVNFTGLSQMAVNKNFAMVPVPNMTDVKVTITNINRARPGGILAYRLTLQNVGTTTVSDTVSLTYAKNNLTIANFSSFPTASGNGRLSWYYQNLQPNEIRHINIQFQVSTTTPLGTVLPATATIKPLNGDQNPANNIEDLLVEVMGSFDPNDIQVDKVNMSVTQVAANEFLNYTIRFQNTGNDTAFTVMVYDTIGSKLDLSSLQILSSSHNYTFNMLSNNVLVWRFNNILLPDNKVNEPGSHGFIRYQIRPKKTATIGNMIENRASIVFDYNDPVITNTAETRISAPTGLQETKTGLQLFRLYPNPAKNYVIVAAEFKKSTSATVSLVNLLGQTLSKVMLPANNQIHFQMPLNELPKGVYLIRLETETGMQTQRLVIQ